jgi:dTDP-4-amino-4,6-dideoxygalactose transaminase
VTRDAAVADRVRTLRNYGAPRKYHHTEFGTNSRLDTIQAAILTVKLPHLSGWNRDRHRLAEQYNSLLKPLKSAGLVPLQNQCGMGHVYHLYVLRVTAADLERADLQAQLAATGIDTGIHYPLPCHLQPAFTSLGYRQGDFPNAERLSAEIVSLPMYPGLTEAQVLRVCEGLTAALARPAHLQISA